MAMTQPPGSGGRRYSEDTVQLAIYFMVAVVVVFVALLIRMQFDKKDPKAPPIRPVRDRAGLIRAVLGQRQRS